MTLGELLDEDELMAQWLALREAVVPVPGPPG